MKGIEEVYKVIHEADLILNAAIQGFIEGPYYLDSETTVAGFRVAEYSMLRKLAYPDPMIKSDAEVKLNSGDPDMVAEGTAQLAQYYVDCLAVKTRFPKA